jgi:transglutaminase-like putative cysteine protease
MHFKNRCQKDSRWHILFVAVLIFAHAFLGQAEEAKPDVSDPPKWVVPIPYNPRAKLAPVDPSLEMRWILRDHQINAANNETFRHEVRQVLTTAGVNNGSHISVDYDPSYQLLTFHWIKIWRGTNAINRLDPDKIQITQAGLDPELLLYSAEKSALLILEDVRPGDVLDYAYTLQGNNPVFAGSFTGRLAAQLATPIDRSVTRLLWPNGRSLYVQNHGTSVKYTAARRADGTEFTWDLKDVPAGRAEPPLPVWYQPFPWIQLSEFQKWADVNRMELGLFTNGAAISKELSAKIAEWRRLPRAEDQVLAALRFVQEDVRYLGIETGASGYKPEAPSTVFARRFGDCKDKTFLFVTILRALKIEAWPTLVNTRLRHAISQLHPSATVFDHVISQVNVAGQVFWLDATANYERGPLSVRSWPNYGFGLVIKPGATALTAIPLCPVQPRTTVTQYLRLGALDGDTELKVITVSEGPDAESIREYYATTPRSDIEHGYLNYYAKFYPDISQTSPAVFTDNAQANRVEVDEFYSIRRIWHRLPEEAFYHCQVYPENVDGAIHSPAMTMRSMPLGVAYPVHQIFHGEIIVPSFALIHPDDQTVQNPAFYFRRTVGITPTKLLLDYDYQSLTDVVPPDGVATYARQLNSAIELLSYTISSE